MERKVNVLPGLITFGFLLAGCVLCGGRQAAYEKAEAATPVTALSPPEGNTTFIGGTTWCVGTTTVAAAELQMALDWACGPGSTDCAAVRPGGPCFEPNTVLSHASFAFNSYYQQNGNSDIACNFDFDMNKNFFFGAVGQLPVPGLLQETVIISEDG